MLGYRSFRSLLMAALVMLAIPAALNAQAYSNRLWSFDFYGGVAIPTSDLSDVADAGPTFGVGANYYVSNRVGLRIEGNLDILGGKDSDLGVPVLLDGDSGGPDIRLWHLNGGVEFDLVDRTNRKVNFTLFVLGGVVFVNSDKFSSPPSPSFPNGIKTGDWQDAYPELRAGFRLGYQLGDCTPGRAGICADLFINGGANLMFGDEEDTEPITSLFSGADTFDTFTSFPIQIGIRINVL